MKHLVTFALLTSVLGCYRTVGTKAKQEIDTETGTKTEPETVPWTNTETQAGTGSESESETQTETESETGTASETESATESETETESETNTESETETESDTQAAAPLPCDNLDGHQQGAPWPTWQGCPSRAGRSNVVGPKSARSAWVLSIRDNTMVGDPVIGKDGTIYLAADDSVAAINSDGSLKWEWSYRISNARAYHAPAIHSKGFVVVQAVLNGLMSALSLEGELIWQFQDEGYAYAHVLIDTAGAIYGIGGSGSVDPVYQPLYALDADGTELWRQTASLGFNTASLAPDGNIVVTTQSNGTVYKYSPDDGSIIWSLEAIMGLQPASISPLGNIYFCAAINTDFRLVAVTPDGNLDWELPLDQRCSSTPAIAADGTLYADLESDLLSVSPSGTVIWRAPIPVEATYNNGGPLIDGDGTVYVIYNGLFAYDPGGELILEEPNDQLTGSAALGADGTLYVPGKDGNLYAFRD